MWSFFADTIYSSFISKAVRILRLQPKAKAHFSFLTALIMNEEPHIEWPAAIQH